MEYRPSWEANRFSASQEIPRNLWDTKVHYSIHKCPLPAHILSHLGSDHAPHPTSWRPFVILFSHLCLGLLNGLFPSGLPTNILYTPLLSPIRVTCPTDIILHFITRKVLVEKYNSLSSSLCSFLYFPVTPTLLDPNNLLNVLFWNILTYDPPSMWATKFHTHTKQQTKL